MGIDYRPHFFRFFQWQLGMGYGERLPTLSELYGFYLFNAYDGYDYLGNPDLKPERALSANLTTIAYFRDNLQVSCSQYFSLVYGYILGLHDTILPKLNMYALGSKTYWNNNHAMVFNSDLIIRYSISNRLSVINTSKYSYGVLYNGYPLPLMPPFKAITSIGYQWERFKVNIENETATGQKRTNPFYGESPSRAFSLLHTNLSYELALPNGQFQFNLSISNLLNAVYKEHLDWGNHSRPGRNVAFGLVFKGGR
ncbi:MAG: TonB-dependent receptor [Bacteroidales bacterium]|nr:TonB-dependent receptor [Bacteroidales bacterium]